jgi:predicted MFS family arabinose efflux permease
LSSIPHQDDPSISASPDVPATSPYAVYVLILLTVIATINVVDRQVMSLLAQSVKHDLGLTDSQLGIIMGPATGLVFAIGGIPLARLADRTSRKWVIGGCLLFFSFASTACGFVANFVQLLFARISVAAGEAGTLPASQSLISGLFPRRRLTIALSVLVAAHAVGTLIAFVAGGYAASHFGWRSAFLVISAPGLAICLLFALTVRDSRLERGPKTIVAQGQARPVGTIRFLWSRPAFRNTCFAYALYMVGTYSILLWMPAYFARSFGLDTKMIGWIMGIAVGGFGFGGGMALGWVTQRLAIRDMRWNLWAVGAAALIGLPFLWATLLSTNLTMVFLIGMVPALICNFHQGPSSAVIQSLAPPQMKSEASAMCILIISIIAGSLGPLAAGMLSDLLHSRFGADSLRYVFLIMSLCWPASAFFYWRASRTLHAGLATVADRRNG